MKTMIAVLAGVLALFGLAPPALSHHSFAVEYDKEKPVEGTGVISRVDWTNPHMRVYVDCTDAKGVVTTWNLELGSPNALMRRGWSRETLKPGDVVTADGYLAKDGTNLANARSITLSDGRTVFAGSSNESAKD